MFGCTLQVSRSFETDLWCRLVSFLDYLAAISAKWVLQIIEAECCYSRPSTERLGVKVALAAWQLLPNISLWVLQILRNVQVVSGPGVRAGRTFVYFGKRGHRTCPSSEWDSGFYNRYSVDLNVQDANAEKYFTGFTDKT